MQKRLWCTFFTFGLVLSLALPVAAKSFFDVSSTQGRPMFHIVVLEQGEYVRTDTDASGASEDVFSVFTPNAAERKSSAEGIRYWADLLAPRAKNTSPLVIALSTTDGNLSNASTGALIAPDGRSELGSALYDPQFKGQGTYLSDIDFSHALGGYAWYDGPMPSIPQNGIFSELTATLLHEMGHALGMMVPLTGSKNARRMLPQLSLWGSHLRDINGNPAMPNQAIADVSVAKPGDFVFRTPAQGLDPQWTGVYFAGPQVMQLLTVDGKQALLAWPDDANLPRVPGLPVLGGNDLSHLELQNANMSHQLYRNWNTYMEAELAAMQDAGLDFDRRNMYGFSVYNDNLIYVNTNPYYARTADGQWMVGQHNPTAYGIGLHVYGSNNNLRQAVDLLSSGDWGLGIRLEGQGNTLTIDPGVRVEAHGLGGTALAVSYGQGHNIVQRGSVSALGVDGIAARFDFGDNQMSNLKEYRGSWRRVFFNETNNSWDNRPLTSALQGPLVKNFDLTGPLAGAQAAIFISKNAHVENMNVMRGAALQGDIVSQWDIQEPQLQYSGPRTDLITNLTFGLLPDNAGRATSQQDSTFALRYDGNILGSRGLKLTVAGGHLSFNGKAELIKAEVNQGATLSGNAEYVLNKDAAYGGGTFTNAGTLSPGNSIGRMVIDGDYIQTASGNLRMEFNATQTDSFVVRGNARLTSGLTLIPLRGFYATDSRRVLTDTLLFEGTLAQNAFANVSMDPLRSPTLSLRQVADQNGFAVVAQRLPEAYSQYAAHKNDAKVGARLYGLSFHAQGDMGTLLGTLDFSSPDGSTVRSALPQLSPAPYGYSAEASAEGNLMIGRLAISHLRGLTASGNGDSQWAAFVTPFASTSTQQADGGIQGYNSSQVGLMGGFTRQEGALALGMYTAFARRQTNTWTSAGAETRASSLHVGGMAQWQPEPTGWHVFAQAQLGLENIDGTRDVSIVDYNRQSQSFSTAFTGTAMLGGGWQWKWDSVAFGPYVGLEYAFNMLPSFQEWNGQATRLDVDAFTRHDVRAVGGVNLQWSKDLDEGRQIRASLDAAWRQDLLDTSRTMRSSFVGYGNSSFDTLIERQGQGSLGLAGSLEVNLRKDVTLAAHVQADVLRPGYNSLGGGLSLRWEF